MNIRDAELDWYRKNGKYPERIKKDSSGNNYVVGDDSWNSFRVRKREYIEVKIGLYLANG